MEITDYIIPAAAIWGAALSTIMLILKIRENKIKIVVDSRNYIDEVENGPARDIYAITAKNFGNRPVTMAYSYIEEYPPRKGGILLSDIRTGYDLSIGGKQIFNGQCVESEFEYPTGLTPIVTQKNFGTKVKVIGIFVDQVGNQYRSKHFEIG